MHASSSSLCSPLRTVLTSPRSRRVLLACGLAVIAGWLPPAASAASMHVAPLRLDLGPQRPVASLVIGNPEQAEMPIQAEVFAWSQDAEGADVYTPTRDVLINPSIFRVPAGGQQIVRVGLQVGAEPTERSYRVFVRQLPQQGTAQAPGLQTLLRIGLPVFVAAAAPVEAIAWRLLPGTKGGLNLMLDNGGNGHIQITSVAVSREGGAELLRKNVSHYVLAGKSSPIPLELPPTLAPDTPLRIEAVAAGGRALPPIVLRVPNAPAAAR